MGVLGSWLLPTSTSADVFAGVLKNRCANHKHESGPITCQKVQGVTVPHSFRLHALLDRASMEWRMTHVHEVPRLGQGIARLKACFGSLSADTNLA